MKKLVILSLLLCCVALAGCSKEAEVDAFIVEFENVTKEMTTKLEAGDVDGAKKAFDAKKESLKASWDDIKGARGFQVGEESQKKLMTSVTTNMGDLGKAVIAGAGKGGNVEEMKSLLEEYKNIFQL